VKEKQPTSAQHMWELLQECWKSIPHEAGWVCKAVFNQIYQSNVFIKPFLHQPMSQSAIQNPSLKPQTTTMQM
jgi:hypothetical protein